MQELKDLPQKNIAVELLKKLLKEEIKKRTKINLVESRKFSEMMEEAIQRNPSGMIYIVESLERILILSSPSKSFFVINVYENLNGI